MEEEVENIISRMTLPELKKLKDSIDVLIESKKCSRKTNLEYLEKQEPKFSCPNDKNHRVKRNGHKNGAQRYWCHDCRESFTITNKKIIKSSTLNYKQLKILLQCMYDYKSLKETALEVGISETSIHELQIKIFEALDQIHNNINLKEEIQVDEKYIRTSFKGFKTENMPRPSRHDGHTNLTSGISNDQLCVIAAIDSYDTLIITVVGTGTASTEMISTALKNKIDKGSILITDSKSSYIEFAKENGLKLIQIPSGEHKKGNYTINDINEIMTEISLYLYKKRGVSSRHLQHHMNFIRYRKIIKYTIEYLEINEAMYADSLKINIKSRSNDVYTTDMPFDIEEYKKWYFDHHK